MGKKKGKPWGSSNNALPQISSDIKKTKTNDAGAERMTAHVRELEALITTSISKQPAIPERPVLSFQERRHLKENVLLDSQSQRLSELLDTHWRGSTWKPGQYVVRRKAFSSSEYFQFLTNISLITAEAKLHSIPLKSLWAEGGVLLETATKQSPFRLDLHASREALIVFLQQCSHLEAAASPAVKVKYETHGRPESSFHQRGGPVVGEIPTIQHTPDSQRRISDFSSPLSKLDKLTTTRYTPDPQPRIRDFSSALLKLDELPSIPEQGTAAAEMRPHAATEWRSTPSEDLALLDRRTALRLLQAEAKNVFTRHESALDRLEEITSPKSPLRSPDSGKAEPTWDVHLVALRHRLLHLIAQAKLLEHEAHEAELTLILAAASSGVPATRLNDC